MVVSASHPGYDNHLTDRQEPSVTEAFRHSKQVGQFLRAFFARMDVAGVRYCVLHGYDGLPDFAPSDVDMVVDGQGYCTIEGIIRSTAKQFGLRVVQRLHYDVPYCFFYVLAFRQEDGAPGFIQLDFLYDPIGIGRYGMTSDALLVGRRKEKEFYAPSASVEACYLFIKKAVKDVLLTHHETRIRELFEIEKEATAALLQRYFGRRVAERVVGRLASGDALEDRSLLRAARLSFWVHGFLFRPWRGVAKLGFLAGRLLKRLLAPTGVVVVLVAPDGGGKSAVAECLATRLRSAFRRVDRIHWRPYLLPPPRKLFQPWRWRETEQPNTAPHARRRKGRFGSIVRFLYYVMDYLLGYFPKVYWPKARTSLVLVERYYYDFLVDMDRHRLDLPEWLPGGLLLFIPEPDLTVFLIGEAKTIHSRKQELSVEAIEEQLKRMNALAKRVTRLVNVSVEKSLTEEVAVVEDAILGALEARLASDD